MIPVKTLKSSGAVALLVLVGGLVATSFVGGALAQGNSGTEKEVTEAVQGIVAAYAQGPAGLDKYFAHYADDMSVMYSRGRWTKGKYYKMWSELNSSGGGVSAARIDDLRIQMSPQGDAAVTTYEMPVVRRFPGGAVPAGETADVTYNMLDVWFKVNGKWMVKSVSFSRLVSTPSSSQTPK
jgi:ketosteroid isomerase-like protein